MKISERLRHIRLNLELSQSAAASKFSIPLSTWKQYEKGPSEPGAGALRNLAAAGVNTNWLLTGDGDMLLESSPPTPRFLIDALENSDREGVSYGHSEQAYNDRMDIKHEEESLGDFALIPMYDVEASAGHGAVVGEELQISQLAFRKDWLKSRGLQQNKLSAIKTKGDSMEPTLYNGDLLLVDTRVEKIIDDAIYVISADHHLIVKRIQQSLDGSVAIISDNPRYKEQNLNPEQAKTLKIAGRVCWYGHEI